MQFAQSTDIVPGVDGRKVGHIQCFNCKRYGHYSDQCPDPPSNVVGDQHHINAFELTMEGYDKEETEEEEVVGVSSENETPRSEDEGAELVGEDTEEEANAACETEDEWGVVSSDDDDSIVVSLQFVHGKESRYKDTDILIDTGSTCSVIMNKKMLLNVTESSKTLRAYTNGGHQDSNQEGDFPGFFKVWYNPKSMLNILSFKDVRKRFRVTVDTGVEAAICVHLDDGKVLKFKEVESGLYLLSSSDKFTKQKVSAYSYLTLVKANKSNFSKRELRRADIAREFRRRLDYPGYRKYFKLLESNYFRDCPITVEDGKRALHIYGPDVESLKGKTVRRTPEAIKDATLVDIPNTIKDLHPHVNLSADYFFV
jgi:hypothetical protein